MSNTIASGASFSVSCADGFVLEGDAAVSCLAGIRGAVALCIGNDTTNKCLRRT